MSACLIRELGLTDYAPVAAAMHAFTQERSDDTPDELWLLQHRPVFTQGQAGKAAHILDPHDVPVVQSDRGGQVTYHGPGQLVVYFLLDVRRRGIGPRALVDLIEASLLETLAGFGIDGQLRKGAPGIYVADRKIAALGLRIRRGCSLHGLSLNVDMDLRPFDWINPCGYAGLQSIQLRDLLPPRPDLLVAAQQALTAALLARLL